MRDVSSLDPMWKPGDEAPAPPRASGVFRGLGRLAHKVAPSLVTWVAGMEPRVRIAWGSTEYHLRRDGIATLRRGGPGYEDNPRTNYNDRLRKRQERGLDGDAETPAPEPAPSPAPEAKPALDLSVAALERDVARKMGREAVTTDRPLSRDPVELREHVTHLRAALQALDDVKDWAIVEGIDDDLYQLHKAVEYTMRNHKASEAKSKLESLFK